MKNLLVSRLLIALLLFVVSFLITVQSAMATPTPTPTSKPTPTPTPSPFSLGVTVAPGSNNANFTFSPALSGWVSTINPLRVCGRSDNIVLTPGSTTLGWTAPDCSYQAAISDFVGVVAGPVNFDLPGILPTGTPTPSTTPGVGGSGNLGRISPPPIGNLGSFTGTGGIQSLLRVIIQLLFIVGFVAAFFCILISAISWIISGGDKAGIQQVKGRITACIVGLVIMLSIFAIVNIIELVFGVNIFSGGLEIPRL